MGFNLFPAKQGFDKVKIRAVALRTPCISSPLSLCPYSSHSLNHWLRHWFVVNMFFYAEWMESVKKSEPSAMHQQWKVTLDKLSMGSWKGPLPINCPSVILVIHSTLFARFERYHAQFSTCVRVDDCKNLFSNLSENAGCEIL